MSMRDEYNRSAERMECSSALVLYLNDDGRVDLGRSGLVSAIEGRRVYDDLYREDPLFSNGERGLRRLRVASLRSECERLGFSVTRPSSGSSRALPKRELVAALVRRLKSCLLYTSPSPRDGLLSRMPSSA